jgi:tRNA-2-methylthio-N6-dimethylallyladenosine synthase
MKKTDERRFEINQIFRQREEAEKSVHIITFGCQMNQHDSGIVAGLLQKAGYATADEPEDADVILFNTCCVRAHAEQRLYGRVSQLKPLKARKPHLIIGIGGCVAQREKSALTDRFPFLDIVFGPNAVADVVSLLKRVEHGERPVICVPEEGAIPSSEIAAPSDRFRIHAWVSAMRGCDNYCSYCVVPYVRGHQRSKAPAEIVGDVRSLASKGVVEVTLLGQNVNSYGQDLDSRVSFSRLLEMLNDVPGLLRIRFTTSHPKDISRKLMEGMRDLPKVCEHIHLPVQSGSSRILERMNRAYTSDEYLRKVDELREIVPGINLTTDIIVGFPGESDDDFGQTRSLVERVQFDGAYIFKYSSRPGTASERFEGKVGEQVIAQRHKELLEFQKSISMSRLEALVGSDQSVLAEDHDATREGHLKGRTRGYRVASFRGDSRQIGKEVTIHISRLSRWTLIDKNTKAS